MWYNSEKLSEKMRNLMSETTYSEKFYSEIIPHKAETLAQQDSVQRFLILQRLQKPASYSVQIHRIFGC